MRPASLLSQPGALALPLAREQALRRSRPAAARR